MKIKKGSKRIVLIFKKIAIKLPRMHFFAFKQYKKNIRLCDFARKHPYLKNHDNTKPKLINSFESFLGFYGAQNNWSEYLFSKKNKSKFKAKTYFSFFGFFNIVKKAKIVKINNIKSEGREIILRIEQIIDCKIEDSLLDGEKYDNWAHDLWSPYNFGLINEKLVLVDYASKLSQRFVEKYGDKIHEKFTFDIQIPPHKPCKTKKSRPTHKA